MSAIAPRAPVEVARRRALGALRHRNYRLFFGGQVLSMVGTWMQSIALPWLVLQLTHSALLVGLALAAQYLPMLVAGPLGSLAASRFDKHRILQVTQTAFIIPATALGLLTLTHVVTYPMVVAAALAWGAIQVVDVPTRQAFVMDMVGREDRVAAVSLNSSIWNLAAVTGPALAGVVIALIGCWPLFLLNALSYVALIVALGRIRSVPSLLTEPRLLGETLLDNIVVGLRYVRCDPVVTGMLVVTSCLTLFAMSRLTLIPFFAGQVLGVGAVGFGLLMSAQAAGAMTGALTHSLVPHAASGRWQLGSGITWAIALIGFSFSPWLPLSLGLLALAGLCQMWFLTTANARLQRVTPVALRGQVMALNAQLALAVAPLGALQAGLGAWLFGPQAAMAIGAALVVAVLIGARILSSDAFLLEPEDYARNVNL